MKVVETELNQQQLELVAKLRQKRGLGSDAEALRFAFREYVKQFLSKGGKKR